MEIGSYIELQFPSGLEYYKGDSHGGMRIARLNSGKAAIWHAFRVTGCRTVWLPYYQCDTIRLFFRRHGIEPKFYRIDREFNPIDLSPSEDEAVLLVNYYGVMSSTRMGTLAARYSNVVIDNCQAFFAKPLEGCMNVYSCRKFIGVPDGAYVIGDGADKYLDEYVQCHSSDTAVFLLQRIEYGCEGRAYESRSVNERRVEEEDAMLMSRLTRTILDGTDYGGIVSKRRENFGTAHGLLGRYNRIDATAYCDAETVPMVYPLVAESDALLPALLERKHFQGHWWSYLCGELPEEYAEHWLSRYIIPITIDQRYGRKELEYLAGIVEETLK